MNKELMLECADFLEGLDPALFDYNVFGERDHCGTKACAAGWLLIGGKLPGFEPQWIELSEGRARLWARCTGSTTTDTTSVFLAAAAVLDLTHDQANDLFLYARSKHPTDSAEHLRIVARDGDTVNVPTEE